MRAFSNIIFNKGLLVKYPKRSWHSSSSTFSKLKEDEFLNQDTENTIEDLIEEKRNKSGLRRKHYVQMNKLRPEFTEDEKYIMPLWMYRKLYGKFGTSANIDTKALWPSVEEMNLEKERESLEFPLSVQEMIAKAKKDKDDRELEIWAIQNKVKENMKNLDKWINEVRERKRKQEMEAQLSLKKKQQQIEEVRQLFGYSISPHDERFQEALDKIVEEDKKRLKKEKKLKKQQQLLEKLQDDAEQQKDALLGLPITEGQKPPPVK